MLYIVKATNDEIPSARQFLWFDAVEKAYEQVNSGNYSFIGVAENEESAWNKAYGIESLIPKNLKSRVKTFDCSHLIDLDEFRKIVDQYFI